MDTQVNASGDAKFVSAFLSWPVQSPQGSWRCPVTGTLCIMRMVDHQNDNNTKTQKSSFCSLFWKSERETTKENESHHWERCWLDGVCMNLPHKFTVDSKEGDTLVPLETVQFHPGFLHHFTMSCSHQSIASDAWKLPRHLAALRFSSAFLLLWGKPPTAW